MVWRRWYLIIWLSIVWPTKQNLPSGRFFVWWYAVTRTGDRRRPEKRKMSCGHFSDDGRSFVNEQASVSDAKRIYKTSVRSKVTPCKTSPTAPIKQNLPSGRFFVRWYTVTRTGDRRRPEKRKMSGGHFSDDGRRLLLSKGSDSDYSEKIATEWPKRISDCRTEWRQSLWVREAQAAKFC